MNWRLWILALCLLGVPQMSTAQTSIAEVYEQIRKNAAEIRKDNTKRDTGQMSKEERIRRSREYWESYYNSAEHKRRLERANKIEENKKLIIQLRAELAAALAEDQREAVRYKY